MSYRDHLDVPDLVKAIREKILELKTDKCSLRILTKTAEGQQMMWLNVTAVDHATFRDGDETSHAILLMAEPMYEHQAIKVVDLRETEEN